MREMPGIHRLPTVFHHDDKEVWRYEDGLIQLATGTGIILGGERYRVVDSWMSFDHHGRFDDGMHIFLEVAKDKDNRVKQLAPDYFR